MEGLALLLWVMLGIQVVLSLGIISLHGFVEARAYQKFRLNPWHITGLSVALNGFALIGAILIPTAFSVFLLGVFISCSLITYVAFGIVIKTLVARLKNAQNHAS